MGKIEGKRFTNYDEVDADKDLRPKGTSEVREGLKMAIFMNVETNTLGDVVFKVDGLDNVITYLKMQIKLMPNPYPEKVFPTTREEAAKLLKSKGLTDNQITAIAGCIARLGWINCQQDILGKLQ